MELRRVRFHRLNGERHASLRSRHQPLEVVTLTRSGHLLQARPHL